MAARSLFDPTWPALGALAHYGRYGGVNWLWAEWIVPFHAVYSISFPVFLSGQLWPATRSAPFLSNRWFAGLAPVPVAAAVIASEAVGAYPISAEAWAAMGATMAALIVAAVRLGPALSLWRPLGGYRPTPAVAAAAAVLLFIGGQNGTWLTPRVSSVPAVGFLLVAFLYAVAGLFATSLGAAGDPPAPRFAFVLGGIGYYVALSPISEFALGRVGLVPIDLTVLALLIRLYRRRAADPTGSAAPV